MMHYKEALQLPPYVILEMTHWGEKDDRDIDWEEVKEEDFDEASKGEQNVLWYNGLLWERVNWRGRQRFILQADLNEYLRTSDPNLLETFMRIA